MVIFLNFLIINYCIYFQTQYKGSVYPPFCINNYSSVGLLFDMFLIIFNRINPTNNQRNIWKMTEEKVRSLKREATQIRKSWKKIRKQIEYYLDYQMWMLSKRSSLLPCCNPYGRLEEQTPKQFQIGYKTLTKLQRAQFYLMNVKIVDKNLNPQKYQGTEEKHEIGSEQRTIKLWLQDRKWFKTFTEVTGEMMASSKKIRIQGVYQIQLRKYVIRRSKNKKLINCLILESIEPFASSDTIRICFRESDYSEITSKIKQGWQLAQQQRIKQMMYELQISNPIIKPLQSAQTAHSMQLKQKQNEQKNTHKQFGTEKTIAQMSKKNELRSKIDCQIDNEILQRSLNTEMFENEELEELDSSLQFFTVTGSVNTNEQYTVSSDDQEQRNPVLRKMNKNQKLGSQNNNNQITSFKDYLKHFYQQSCRQKGKPILFRRSANGHIILGNQWTVRNNGDFVFTNQEKIKKQSSVFKMVIKKLGSDLLSHKGFNISLPALIFGINTYLQKMAQGYIYAPRFLQKAVSIDDHVERMRNIVCFLLGVTVSFVQADKAFNPVLGETYQGLIDGCPVYAEQISHHPPISSVLFYGRGYKIYGNFEPTVEIGLNKLTGINKGTHCIQFQDGTTITCQNAQAVMHSLAFGQRKLQYNTKSEIIDKSNRIVCEINWGKQNDSNPLCKYHDFVKAKIMKIRKGVNIDNLRNIKKKDIEQEYDEMHGRWTGQIYSKGSLFFDIETEHPYSLEHYSPCLRSDSRFRKDLNHIKNKNYDEAQICKDQLQQAERYYRKLRKNHSQG